ncbi:hypothetical protein V6Z11_D12G234100 [Gossypium hirsutum]
MPPYLEVTRCHVQKNLKKIQHLPFSVDFDVRESVRRRATKRHRCQVRVGVAGVRRPGAGLRTGLGARHAARVSAFLFVWVKLF